jgi:hypothetical protein
MSLGGVQPTAQRYTDWEMTHDITKTFPPLAGIMSSSFQDGNFSAFLAISTERV